MFQTAFVLKQVLATDQFQTLTRSHSTGIAVPAADLININIETAGNGVQSIAFAYSVGNVLNRVAADFCRSSCNTEDLAFFDIVAFDVVGNNQISYAQVVTFGDVKQRIAIFYAVCACCKCCSLCVLLSIYTCKTCIDALLLFSGIGCDTCSTSAFSSNNSLNLFGFRSRFSNSRCRFLCRSLCTKAIRSSCSS